MKVQYLHYLFWICVTGVRGNEEGLFPDAITYGEESLDDFEEDFGFTPSDVSDIDDLLLHEHDEDDRQLKILRKFDPKSTKPKQQKSKKMMMERYRAMVHAGYSVDQVRNKMIADGINPKQIDITLCPGQCCITKNILPAYVQDPRLEYGGESTRVLFLLGAPYTGTTALHYLLGTSNNVAILGGENIMKPEKEGWHLTGVKRQKKPEARWDGKLDWVNWNDLAVQYGNFWDQSKPLLVENSPPEIQVPEKLMEAFTPIYGKVRFILLIRGECDTASTKDMSSRSALYKNVIDKYPKETFVIRYEDLCLRWNKVLADLKKWEPRLSDIDIDLPPVDPRGHQLRRSLAMSHAAISVKKYCEKKVEKWAEGVQCAGCQVELDNGSLDFGYDGTVVQQYNDKNKIIKS